MKARYRRERLALRLGIAMVVLSGADLARAEDIQVDAATRYQTMAGWESILSGFEVAESSNMYSPAWVQQAPKIMDYLVNEMGINRVRVELLSGFENPGDYFADFQAGRIDYDGMKAHFYEKINDNDDPSSANASGFHFGLADFRIENELLPIKRSVEANGEKLYVSVCYVDFNAPELQGSLRHGTTPNEYAELVTVFFDHLKNKYGVTPDALEIVLEPENTDDWRGTQIGQAAVAAADRLRDAGYSPDFIAPSTTNAANAIPYFDDAIAVSGAANLFTMLSYHRYQGGDYAAIDQTARTHGVQTGMLEFFTASVDDLVQDLTVANVSAWEKYAIASPQPNSDYAYLYADVSNPSEPVVSFGAKAAQMMPYFRFARLGAVRVGATSSSGGITPVAFINPNGTNVVVVKGSAAALTVTGIRDAVYGVRSVASDGTVTNGTDVTAAGGVLNVTVPAGVTAIYDKDAINGSGSSGTGGTSGAGGSTGTGTGGSTGTGTGGTSGMAGASAAGSASGAGGSTATDAGGTATPGRGGSASPAGANGEGGSATISEPDGESEALKHASDDAGCGCRIRGSTATSRRAWLAAFGCALAAAYLARRRVLA